MLDALVCELHQIAPPLASWTEIENGAVVRFSIRGGTDETDGVPMRIEETFANAQALLAGNSALRTRVALADRLVVSSESDLASLQEILTEVGAVWLKSPGPELHLVRVPGTAVDWRELDRVAEMLATSEGITFAEKDYLVFPAAEPPDDPSFGQQWALTDIDILPAWDLTTGDPEVVVAVVDTGVDLSHPDLAHSLYINPGETGLDADGRDKAFNGVDDDGNRFIDDWRGWDFGGDDTQSLGDNDPSPLGKSPAHGTQIAGIVSAQANNTTGIAGIAPNVKILPIKVSIDSSGNAFRSSIINAQRYLIDLKQRTGAHVIANFSWDLFQVSDATVYREEIAVSAAGIHSIWAAGNGGLDIDSPLYDAFYQTTRLWAQLPGVLAVGSSTSGATRRASSNYGAHSVHLFAPGESILTTTLGGSYASVNGTSFAAPHVAAVVALVRSIYPGLDTTVIKQQALQTVTPTVALADLCASGGRLNASQFAAAAREHGFAAFRLRALGLNADALVAELVRPRLRTPYQMSFEASANLTFWEPFTPSDETAIASGEIERFSYRLPIEGSARFFRVKVNAPAP